MNGLATSKRLHMPAALTLLAALVLSLAVSTLSLPRVSAAGRAPQLAPTSPNPAFCSRIGTTIWASSGAQMYCFGPQPNGPAHRSIATTTTTLGPNVNAANLSEDITPAGARAYGQSETSIAAVGPYVVEAWNDSTAFFSRCPSPMHKEEGTGLGFSANGGTSFVDEGGVPNANCTADLYLGDPSVEAWSAGGSDYFYISSLFDTFNPAGDPTSYVALAACKASGKGASATLSCSQPILAAASTQCVTRTTVCSFLDKDFLSIDPKHGRLYVSYTEFGVLPPPDPLAFGQIELAACDIGTPSGGPGPLGGTAGTPVCRPGGPGAAASPYLVVAPAPQCLNEGAYPAVDVARGDVYVAYEFNLLTSVSVPICASLPIQNVVTYVPFACLTLLTAACPGPVASTAVNVVSMELAQIPGYNRHLPQGPGPQDFPRLAVSDAAGTVSMVWNDARLHPLGDIFMQSFALGSLTGVQSVPLRLNRHANGGLHFLPALRNANQQGDVNVSWYERSNPSTALTNVVAALHLDPRTTSTPASTTLVTTVPTNWVNTSSFIIPNFGDYTDNYVIAMPDAPWTGETLFVAWSDGRLGEPQPFEAHTETS